MSHFSFESAVFKIWGKFGDSAVQNGNKKARQFLIGLVVSP